MEIMYLLVLWTLTIIKVMVQGAFAKKNVKTTADGLVFNGTVFLFSALLFINHAFSSALGVILFGIVFGIMTVTFQLCYITAMSCGNVSVTVLITNLSMVIPLSVSIIFFNERPGILKYIGFALTVVALVLNVDRQNKTPTSKRWFVLAIVTSLANGSLLVLQQLFGKTQWAAQTQGFVSWSYITATLVSIILYLILKSKGHGVTYKIRPKLFLIGLIIGCVLATFQVVNTRAIASMDGTFLFPTYNGGVLVLTGISSVLILKEKLKKNQIISMTVGVVAIILMNL